MSLFDIFNVAGSAMSAQSLRLNTTASNMANAQSVASSPEEAYRARQPVFAAVFKSLYGNDPNASVKVLGVTESQAPAPQRYDPGNPLANEEGYVFLSNVNAVDEMANMISASRSYQNNVEVMNTSKQLLLSVLRLGQ